MTLFRRLTWDDFGSFFPGLTHLSLPGFIVRDFQKIDLTPYQLVKLDLGQGGLTISVGALAYMIEAQDASLETLRFGSLFCGDGFDWTTHLTGALGRMSKLRVLDIQVPREELSGRPYCKRFWKYISTMGLGRPPGPITLEVSGLLHIRIQPQQVLCQRQPTPTPMPMPMPMNEKLTYD